MKSYICVVIVFTGPVQEAALRAVLRGNLPTGGCRTGAVGSVWQHFAGTIQIVTRVKHV
jgi:hypothetical protein